MISESSSSACSSYESSMSVDVTLDTLKNPKTKNPLGVKTIITSKPVKEQLRNVSLSNPTPATKSPNQNNKYNFQHSTPSKNEQKINSKIASKITSKPVPAPRNSILNSSITSRDQPNIFKTNNDYRDSIRKMCAGVVRNSSLRSSGGVANRFRKPNPDIYRAIGTPLSTSFHNSTIASNKFNSTINENSNKDEICFEILV